MILVESAAFAQQPPPQQMPASVEGTIDEQHLVVRTKTRNVLTFRGRVEGPRVQGVVQGNTFNGTFHDRGGTGSFQGQRSN